MIESMTLNERVWLGDRFRNSVSLGGETTYIVPRQHGVDFNLNGKGYMIPWGSIKLVCYA